MKNFIQPADTLTVPAPVGGAVSGMPVIYGAIFGVATTTQSAGIPVAIKRTGVFELPKVSAQAFAIGDKLYWDATNLQLTTAASGNTLAGVASEAAINPSSVGRCSLRGFYPI